MFASRGTCVERKELAEVRQENQDKIMESMANAVEKLTPIVAGHETKIQLTEEYQKRQDRLSKRRLYIFGLAITILSQSGNIVNVLRGLGK